MLEVKIPGVRDGRGYLKVGPTTTLNRGKFVKLDTAAWSTEAPGTPGKAYNGAISYVAATSGDKMNKFCYPFNKLLYKPEDSMTASDTATSGDGIIVYKTGQYETDQYATVTWTGVAPGTMLFLDANSCLTTSYDDNSFVPRARFLGIQTSFDSNYAATGLLWFEMIDQVYMVSGMLGF